MMNLYNIILLRQFIEVCLPLRQQSGLAFGTGTAVAHRAVDAVLGPRIVHHETVTSSAPAATPVQNTNNFGDACGGQSKALQDVCFNPFELLTFFSRNFLC